MDRHEATDDLLVNLPEADVSKVSYVNTRGAALNYVMAMASNKETAHCSDRSE
jgi:hypothetical protein